MGPRAPGASRPARTPPHSATRPLHGHTRGPHCAEAAVQLEALALASGRGALEVAQPGVTCLAAAETHLTSLNLQVEVRGVLPQRRLQ